MEVFFGAGILVGVASLDVMLDGGSPSQITFSGVDHSENVSSNTCTSIPAVLLFQSATALRPGPFSQPYIAVRGTSRWLIKGAQ